MKICVAQFKPHRGDINANINRHIEFIHEAVFVETDLIIFPELSITGYEPELAKELACSPDDNRFNIFQKWSDSNQLTICVGMPTNGPSGILISVIIFQPQLPRRTYSKQHIHEDEEPYFTRGTEQVFIEKNDVKIALAICYELSVAQHAEYAHENGAGLYLVSVAKTASGVEKARLTLADIAKRYGMTVLLSNAVGMSDGVECGGMSSVWSSDGQLQDQLNDTEEGLLICDTTTNKTIAIPI